MGINAVSQILLLSLVARFGGPERVGQLALGLALAVPVLSFTNLQLRQIAVVRGFSAGPFRSYVALRLVTSALGFLATVAIGAGITDEMATLAVVAMVALLKSIDTVPDLYYAVFQRAERMDIVGVSQALRGGAALVAGAIGALFSGDLLTVVGCWTALSTLILVAFDGPCLRMARRMGTTELPGHPRETANGPFEYHRHQLSRFLDLVRSGLPMGVSLLLMSLAVTLPRLVLEAYRSTTELGHFAAVVYPTSALGLLVGAVAQAASARLARDFTGARVRFLQLTIRLCAMACGLGILGTVLSWFAGASILRVLYGDEFSQLVFPLVVTSLAGTAWAVQNVLGYAATAAGRFRVQLPAAMATLAGAFVLSFLTIPRWGVTGAAITSAGTGLVGCSVFLVLLISAHRQRHRSNVHGDSRGAAYDPGSS